MQLRNPVASRAYWNMYWCELQKDEEQIHREKQYR